MTGTNACPTRSGALRITSGLSLSPVSSDSYRNAASPRLCPCQGSSTSNGDVRFVFGGGKMGEGMGENAQRSTLNVQRPIFNYWTLKVERWAHVSNSVP